MDNKDVFLPGKTAARGEPAATMPGEPYQLLAFFPVISTIGAGILLGLNWKKFGKPRWVLPTILLAIGIPAIGIALIIGWVTLLGNSKDIPFQITLLLPMLVFGVNLGYLFAVARLQNGAMKAIKKQGMEILNDYPFDLDGAFLFTVIFAIVVAGLGTFVLPMLTR
jgi:hypothetical protein